jgi:hypothetical protein
MTSISSFQPVAEYLEIGRKFTGFGYFSFYPIVFVMAVSISIPLLGYLFPEKKKKLLRQWKQRNP